MGWPEQAAGAMRASLAAFGETVSYQPDAGGPPLSVSGVFSDQLVRADNETGVERVSSTPNLFVMLADFPTPPAHPDRFTRAGVLYQVAERDDDGEGGTLLISKRAG